MQVVWPEKFSTACTTDSKCSAYPLSLEVYYYSINGNTVKSILDVVNQYPVLPPYTTPMEAVSGRGRALQGCGILCSRSPGRLMIQLQHVYRSSLHEVLGSLHVACHSLLRSK